MIWGMLNNEKIKATPNLKGATCELCNSPLIAKCGDIKIWHWAHVNNIDCDPWWEPESEWHINWKSEFPKEQQEVQIKKCMSDYCNDPKYHAPCNHINCVDCEFKKHRADIKTRTGTIIELQNSTLSVKKVKEREEFYGNKLIWLLNSQTIGRNIDVYRHWNKSTTTVSFNWKWKPSIIKFATHPVFVDFGENILKINSNLTSGTIIAKENFLSLYCDIFKREDKDGATKQ